MQHVARLKRIADLDMEPLISAILLRGMLLSMGLMIAGLAWQWATAGQLGVNSVLQGINVFHFLLGDVRHLFVAGLRPEVLVDFGVATLLLIPYVRVLASVVYFGWVERQWLYTLLTSGVFLILTYMLFFG